MTNLLLAFEGGGSKTRILLADCGGTVHAQEKGASSSELYIQRATYARAILRMLKRIKRAAGKIPGRVTLAGLAGPMDRLVVEQSIRTVFGPIECVPAGESDIALALYDLRAGVSLVAGTGSSCRARNERGETVSCGGFGPQFDDEGSGYWIGREAIAAVARAEDGRGPRTNLREYLLEYLKIARLWEIHKFTNGNGHLFPPRVAGFAPHVLDAARDGDAVALHIVRAAGRALARLVLITAAQTRFRKHPIPLVLTGGVFNAGRLIIAPLKQALRASGTPFHVYPEAPEPVLGIIKILQLHHKGKRGYVS